LQFFRTSIAYHDRLLVVGPDGQRVALVRSFEREQTIYDWTQFITLVERKLGALRNGAPFKTMPSPCSGYSTNSSSRIRISIRRVP
jgi:hypothetical protein